VHASLDIVLASTIQYNNIQTGELLNTGASPRQDSNYESDPGPAGLESDAFCPDIAYESDAEVFGTSSACAGKQNHFEGAGEVIGDVAGFEDEDSNRCGDPWAPFNRAEGFKLASWFIEGKVSNIRIKDYLSSGLGNAERVGYSSVHTLDNDLRFLDPYSQYLQWFAGQVENSQRTLAFFYRSVVGCVSYLLRQIAYRDDLIYVPRWEYEPSGQRIYAEMHTADWWWGLQVEHLSPTLVWKTLAD